MANLSENKKFHYIYKTTNVLDNKFYVGAHSTNDLEDDYLGSGTRLWRSIRKHGKENFKKEILEYYSSREELMKREKEFVNEELLKEELCMNLKPGGNGGLNNAEHARKFHIGGGNAFKKKLETDPEYRKKHCENSSKNIKLYREQGILNPKLIQENFNWLGKKHSAETKSKQSVKKIGSNNHQFGTMWITNGTINKKIKKEETIPLGFYKGRMK